MINAEFLMLISRIGAFLMTLYWVRVRELRERLCRRLAGRGDAVIRHRSISGC